MFDVGMFELLLIMVMGLVVLGPERLPEAARLIAAWLSKTKRTVADFKAGVEQEVHAHEMRERIKNELEKAGLADMKAKFETEEAKYRQKPAQTPDESPQHNATEPEDSGVHNTPHNAQNASTQPANGHHNDPSTVTTKDQQPKGAP
jgi:sec-independent protein translocase protein TatB